MSGPERPRIVSCAMTEVRLTYRIWVDGRHLATHQLTGDDDARGWARSLVDQGLGAFRLTRDEEDILVWAPEAPYAAAAPVPVPA